MKELLKDRIKNLRLSLSLTQEEFAKHLGVKRNTIGNYETGNRIPSNQIIVSICKEFNVNEIWLRTGEGEMFVSLNRDEELSLWAGKMLSNEDNEFTKKLVHMLSKLDVEDWKVLEKMATLMAKEKAD